MRGEVVHFDEQSGTGLIDGEDGQRYVFGRADAVDQIVPPRHGTPVTFLPEGGSARQVVAAAVATLPGSFGRNAHSATPERGLWGYFIHALTTDYAAFSGRARRKEYWGFALFATLLTIVATVAGFAIDAAAGNFDPNGGGPIFFLIALGLCLLGTLIPWIAVTIRRQHDIGLAGWFILLGLIPYVGGIIVLVFTLIPSQKHENRWGPMPAGVTGV